MKMRCVICRNSQHVECYGYLGSSPGSPSTGVCYTCLSQLDGAGVQLSEISDICIKRRALYYLLQTKGLASLEDLAKYLSKFSYRTIIDSYSADVSKTAINLPPTAF